MEKLCYKKNLERILNLMSFEKIPFCANKWMQGPSVEQQNKLALVTN